MKLVDFPIVAFLCFSNFMNYKGTFSKRKGGLYTPFWCIAVFDF